jgi:hypothetical protein
MPGLREGHVLRQKNQHHPFTGFPPGLDPAETQYPERESGRRRDPQDHARLHTVSAFRCRQESLIRVLEKSS